MRKPVIGIFASIELDKNYMFAGYPRILINQDYSRSIEAAGGVPILIAPTSNFENLESQIALCDGILFSGGHDLNSLRYNEQPTDKLGELNPIRDAFEFEAIAVVDRLKKPMFGICRGSQLINVYFGGSLHQDNSFAGATIKHVHKANPDMPVHAVTFEDGSFLKCASGVGETTINSFHHQSVNVIAPGFKAAAVAPDGIVEAIERVGDGPFVAGVQWHPEMMSHHNAVAKSIFNHFIQIVAAQI